MSFDMSETTFRNVTSIDLSPTVIAQMRQRYPTLAWEVMDCSKLQFPDESFDLVFDKGTTDSLLCGPAPLETVQLTLLEVERILTRGGLFVIISFAKPSKRVSLLKSVKLRWHLHKAMFLPDPNDHASLHYVYIFQKYSSALPADSDSDEEEEEEEEEEAGEEVP
jgi:ubiquinone/menaquinone biosynthesis C-methylase UbiE